MPKPESQDGTWEATIAEAEQRLREICGKFGWKVGVYADNPLLTVARPPVLMSAAAQATYQEARYVASLVTMARQHVAAGQTSAAADAVYHLAKGWADLAVRAEKTRIAHIKGQSDKKEADQRAEKLVEAVREFRCKNRRNGKLAPKSDAFLYLSKEGGCKEPWSYESKASTANAYHRAVKTNPEFRNEC